MNHPNGHDARFPAEPASGASTAAQPEVQPVRAVRLGPADHLAAALRLVSDAAGNREQAARRFLASASSHGIDLSLMWGVLDPASQGGRAVRQVCLAVPGAGRTAMLFLSGPSGQAALPAEERRERVAAIDATCEGLAADPLRRFRLAQALPEPSETWAVEALRAAGFIPVGELDYLQRPAPRARPRHAPRPETLAWPDGVTVCPVGAVERGDADRPRLIAALERSYQQTLDCPELCGLRETEDILDSHVATGEFDPSTWWIVLLHGEPHGCMLLSRLPEQGCVELVYLGLSPELRGRQIGSRLLEAGLAVAMRSGPSPVSCAVDRRNVPAIRLYERLGFRSLSSRVALVRPL